ncbi:competence/damage-inducible protein cinA [Hypnocyclicus thermotrophus]|uniref:CinA-like protein n=1 Tax=Hypnocyclicus thermotrophus TaxID=1627895 RepID=A0AA46I5T1_9FUSO|nr:CinA family nicotinamide mononucleotide deamidase-related protein [Hypnocyclicus thermotrophus]TDT69732.1 competence/damage-inducible protein cinA [Hypnocyclicus thermotrophus]
MRAYIILVGTELLSGMMIDTNSIYIAEELNKIGITIIGKSVVSDDIDEIIDLLKYVYNKSDIVIFSGGLGPTIDDVTRDAISKFLNIKNEIDGFHYDKMIEKFKLRNIKIFEKNKKEVMVPTGSEVFYNEPGIAPGFYINKIAAFPGVPIELKNLFPKFLSFLKEKYSLNKEVYIKDILFWGIAESILENEILDIIKNYENEIIFEFLVKDYGIIFRMQTEKHKIDLVNEIKNKIDNKLSGYIIGEDNERIETNVINKLIKQNKRISLGESCTGGLIASKLVSVSGASKVFTEGIVVYSNEAKHERLNVKKETIKKYGAVSKETVYEMLKGLKTEIGIAVSGIAGPNGGTKEKPVGTVYIGIKKDDIYNIKKHHFNGNREKIRERASLTALFELLKLL